MKLILTIILYYSLLFLFITIIIHLLILLWLYMTWHFNLSIYDKADVLQEKVIYPNISLNKLCSVIDNFATLYLNIKCSNNDK